MGRSLFQQDTQIWNSNSYDDTLAAGATLESGAAQSEDDFNGIRSQAKRFMWADSAGNWYDDLTTTNSKKRGINNLNSDLDDIEEKRLLFRADILTDITVTAAQNWEILSVAGTETPTQTAAVDTSTAEGAVVAYLAAFNTNSLVEVAGDTALTPKNLCLVRNATTGDPILSSNRQVFALIQSEVITDGHTFNDTTQRVQLSFVRPNATFDDLEACPVGDIAGTSINYSYVRRVAFDNIPEDAYLNGGFVDQSGSVDVTLTNAIANQSGPAPQTQDIEWRITDTFTLDFQDSTGGTNLLRIAPNAAGDEIEINVNTLDVNTTLDVDFSQGLKTDTGGTEIDIGVTAGSVETTGAADLRVNGAGELYLDDGNQTGSTWAQTNGIKLSDTTAEWDTFEVNFGEVSILNAFNQLSGGVSLVRDKTVAVLTANVAADTNVTGAGGTPNLDAQLGDYSTVTFLTDVDVFLNGQLLRNGVNAAANNDVYPGTTPANGDLMFEFPLKGTGSKPDVLSMIIWG